MRRAARVQGNWVLILEVKLQCTASKRNMRGSEAGIAKRIERTAVLR